MKLNKALDHFKILANRTDNKRERKVYDKFVGILSNLQTRDLSEEQILSIEEKMEELNLSEKPIYAKKSPKKKLSLFIKYLQEKLSLVTEGYYTALGVTFGMMLGVALAPTLERQMGISINMGLGMLLGAAIGQYLDTKAAKENRVLRMNLG